MDNRKLQAGALATPPAAEASPSTGYPTDGNPGGGIEASIPGAYWFHQIGEELRAVIEEAGLTPSDATLTQLRDAIKRLITGGDFKDSVRAATTANITLSGAQTIDGVSVVAGDRVLVKDQANAIENGIYVVAAGVWSRATDADTGAELSASTCIPVEGGTLNADTIWMVTNDGPLSLGTNALIFAIKSGDASTTRKGMVQLATTAEAQALTDALKAITPSTLAGAFQGSNQSRVQNGYQKLPGGLICQWGVGIIATPSTPTNFTLPIAFPTAALLGVCSASPVGAAAQSNGWSTTTIQCSSTSAGAVDFIIIGH